MSTNGGGAGRAAVWVMLAAAGCQHRAMLDGPTKAQLDLTSLPAAVRGGAALDVTVTLTTNASDANAQVLLEHSRVPGWETVARETCSGGPFAARQLTFSWEVPLVDEPAHALRATWKGVYGNHVVADGASFLIDSTPPSITSFTIGTGAQQETAHVLPLTLIATDGAGSGVVGVMLSLDPSFAGAVWRAAARDTFDLPRRTGTYTVYAKVRDAVGFESEVASTAVDLVIHTPPVVNFLEPLVAKSYGVVDAPVSVSWVASASAGLAEVRLGYSLDNGVSIVPWVDDLPAVTAGCNVAGASGCAVAPMPAAALGRPFWIALAAVDNVGQVAQVLSLPLNATSRLSLAAGRNSSALGGSALATALELRGGVGRDPVSGDLFLSAHCQLLRFSPATGALTRAAGNPRRCGESGDGGPFAAVRTNPRGDVLVGAGGDVYWITYGFVWRADAALGTAAVYLGDASGGTPSTADGTPRRGFDTGGTLRNIALGAGDRLYAVLATYFSSIGATHRELFVVADDGTVGGVAGTRATDAAPAPAEGAPARQAALLSFAVAPGSGTRPDRVFAMGRGAGSRLGLWEVLADGTLHLLRDDVADELLGYLPSRHQLVLSASTGDEELRFVDPDRPEVTLSPVLARDGYGGAARAVTDDGDGGFYYTSSRDRYVLRVDAAGITDVYAGIDPSAGDGLIAPHAEMRGVAAVAVGPSGDLFVYEEQNGGVWRIDTAGVIGATAAAPPGGFYPYLQALSTGVGGPVLAGGPAQPGARGLRDLSGQCLVFCGDPDTSPFAASATTSTDPMLGLADASPDGSSMEMAVALDGATAYIYVVEHVGQTAGVRTHIKRVTSTSLEELAGDPLATPVDPSVSAAALGITGGATLAGTPAGWPAVGRGAFQAGAGRVFVLQSASPDRSPWTTPYSLWSGAPGGTWRREVNADVRAYVVDGVRGRVYYVAPDNDGHPVQLWRKTIGTTDDQAVADLDDVVRGVQPLAVVSSATNSPVVYLLLGDYDAPTSIPANSLYRWVDSN